MNMPSRNSRQQSSESQTFDNSRGDRAKRKSDHGSGSGAHKRAKRNRYISIACNECKRRKIKCNGEVPCQRCGNLSLECLYAPNCCSSGFKDSEEFRAMSTTIQMLREQVNNLCNNLTEHRGPQDRNALPYQSEGSYPQHPSLARSSSQGPYHDSAVSSPQSRGRHRHFQGPTSSAFNFGVANSSLQTMGITETENPGEELLGYDESPLNSPRPYHPPMAPTVTPPFKDPLWKIERDEAIRLCRVYADEMGITSPMFDIEHVIENARLIYGSTESVGRTGPIRGSGSGLNKLISDDISILRVIVAIALVIEGGGRSELGTTLFECVQKAAESKLWEPVEVKGLILLALVAQYHFHQNDEVQAYRMGGIAARLCLELGLHRHETLTKAFTTEEECIWALKLFWSIYVSERRLSFGTGMPFAIQDADIDPLLPELDDSTPYLNLSIAYARFSSKVWRCINGIDEISNENKNDIGYLDYQILQWQNSIPTSLRYYPLHNLTDAEAPSRAQHRLQVLLYLRTNQMRILIHRPVLHSATSIMENKAAAQSVIDVAKDTIGVLTRLSQTSDIYRTQQVCFNYFLVSALAVVFLAVSHAPAEFNAQVRDEFYMALDLVKGFSTKSYISQRLWRTIKGLKELGPKLGLVSRHESLTDATDPHSSAAVAMAGLAGHAIDEMTVYPSPQSTSPMDGSPMNGQQMSYELTTLFEAAGGYTTGNVSNANNPPQRQQQPQALGVIGFTVTTQPPPASDTSSQNPTVAGQPSLRGGHGNGNGGEFSKIMQYLY